VRKKGGEGRGGPHLVHAFILISFILTPLCLMNKKLISNVHIGLEEKVEVL